MKNPGTNSIYRGGWALSRFIFDYFTRWEIYGTENIPKEGPFLLAGNHASFFDPPAFGSACPRELHYFARSTLFVGRFGNLIRQCRAIPVDRDGGNDLQAFREVFKVLRSGGGLLVFPEGTRSDDGALREARPGVGMIAVRAKVPIIPARIHGSFRIFSRHHKLPDLKNRLSVVYGPPLDVADLDPGDTAPRRFLTISQRVLDAIGQLNPPPRQEV